MKKFVKTSKLFLKLLIQGTWVVDSAHSFVIILVIMAIFSTPLMLGSIKNKVYVAVKEQAEKENNAREITIRLSSSADVPLRLDNEFLAKVKNSFPQFKITGNHKHIVMIEGPKGEEMRTLQNIVPRDPRTEFLQIRPKISDDFGLFDLVVSNSLGQLLYGENQWEDLWKGTQFMGKPLKLFLSTGRPIQGEFRIVARQAAPGFRIYGNTQIGLCLEKYSMGLGCQEYPELGLPTIPRYIPHNLPTFEARHCLVQFPLCTQQEQILKRLKTENYRIENATTGAIAQYRVTLTKVKELDSGVEIQPTKGDCEAHLEHHLEICPSSIITPSLEMALTTDSSRTLQLAGITAESYELLPGIQELANQQGGSQINFEKKGLSKRGIEIIAPYNKGVRLGEILRLQVAETTIPAIVVAYYRCSTDCRFYAHAETVFRLQNVADGIALFDQQYDPPIFFPLNPSVDYYEILFYANKMEEVKTLALQLREKFSGYNIEYHSHAIDKVERSDKRFSTLFHLTLWLSIIATILTVGALAKLNVDRRKRQMAQLFILGHSKTFVSFVLVFEYVLLTLVASLVAAVVSSGIFTAARHFMQADSGLKEFNTIIASMSLDQGAFISVFITVVSLTILVAGYAAYYASKSDPVTLLD